MRKNSLQKMQDEAWLIIHSNKAKYCTNALGNIIGDIDLIANNIAKSICTVFCFITVDY